MLKELAKLHRGLLFSGGYLTDLATLRRAAREAAAHTEKAAGCSTHDPDRKTPRRHWRPRWIW